jgi:hypothetical protein
LRIGGQACPPEVFGPTNPNRLQPLSNPSPRNPVLRIGVSLLYRDKIADLTLWRFEWI